jgi:hypothetical protein
MRKCELTLILVCHSACFHKSSLAAQSCFPTLIWVSWVSSASAYENQPPLTWNSLWPGCHKNENHLTWVDSSLMVPWVSFENLGLRWQGTSSPTWSTWAPSNESGLKVIPLGNMSHKSLVDSPTNSGNTHYFLLSNMCTFCCLYCMLYTVHFLPWHLFCYILRFYSNIRYPIVKKSIVTDYHCYCALFYYWNVFQVFWSRNWKPINKNYISSR